LRRDLFHRVAHNIVRIPPLRERIEDIEELCAATLKRVRETTRSQVFHLHEDALSILCGYDWPGNVRELQGIIENAAHRAQLANRTEIYPQDIQLESPRERAPFTRSLNERIEDLKRRLIQEAVAECRGNHLQAAKILGVDRGTLRRVLNRVVS
jgi:arginine utilization regulatory protein